MGIQFIDADGVAQDIYVELGVVQPTSISAFTLDPPSTVAQGDPVTVEVEVTPSNATGQVIFTNYNTDAFNYLPPTDVVSGVATLVSTTIPGDIAQLRAQFVPNSPKWTKSPLSDPLTITLTH